MADKELSCSKTCLNGTIIHVGVPVVFRLNITNTGTELIDKLEVRDEYSETYFSLIDTSVNYTNIEPIGSMGADYEVIVWSFTNADLGPGETMIIDVRLQTLLQYTGALNLLECEDRMEVDVGDEDRLYVNILPIIVGGRLNEPELERLADIYNYVTIALLGTLVVFAYMRHRTE